MDHIEGVSDTHQGSQKDVKENRVDGRTAAGSSGNIVGEVPEAGKSDAVEADSARAPTAVEAGRGNCHEFHFLESASRNPKELGYTPSQLARARGFVETVHCPCQIINHVATHSILCVCVFFPSVRSFAMQCNAVQYYAMQHATIPRPARLRWWRRCSQLKGRPLCSSSTGSR